MPGTASASRWGWGWTRWAVTAAMCMRSARPRCTPRPACWAGCTSAARSATAAIWANTTTRSNAGRTGSHGVALQGLVGYDGRSFHISAGSWFYASARDRGRYHAAFLPYGVLRLRVGSLDGWHFNLRLLDGAPFTAEGGGPGLRLHLGLPPRGRHRLAGGVYTSLGEKVVGLSVADEIDLRQTSRHRLGRPSLRVGGVTGHGHRSSGPPGDHAVRRAHLVAARWNDSAYTR